MTDMTIAAPLAAALSAKGYDSLTAVQTAMLADGVAGRDLLVSAQTGSGKTVAFGLAIAGDVLGGQDRLLFADKPLALIVAPTRELALQVRREFEWLYAEAGAMLASCVGGMDYRNERRALERGAHVVVGTPGRLRDHIERGSLDLSGVKAVVLDEADEMLDLGFAEDLEFILAAAAEERRTLMFSATVPKEIEKLAATFQRDALRIAAQGEAKQHVDIEYRALSVQARDKEHAIFNVLRYYEAQTAIVFCKTRANVNHLFARMQNRGFQAVALSGELSQSERMHALQALRDGRARVCIATDVAARGIDLPGLELVVHADLPSNSETMLHRSGRTGRAGRKGVSALIVPPAEFRKAQRLLAGAKVVAEWGKAPGADEVQEREDARLMEHPMLAEAVGDEGETAAALVARYGAEQVAAAFIRLWRDGRSAPEVLSDSLPPPAALPPRERGEFGPSVWYRLSVGHTGRAEARWLLPKICETGSIAKDGIGAIRVQQDHTLVQIAEAVAGRFGAMVEIEPGLMMERIEGEPSMERPERPQRAERPERRVTPKPVREERGDRPSYSGKPPRIVEDEGGADAAPAAVRAAAPKAEWHPDGEKKPYAKKPYTPREDGERKPYEKKPYAAREDGDRKPYVKKPYAGRDEGEKKPYEKKPYAPRDGGDRKPYDKKPYAAREDGERKPYAPRGEGEKRPYAPRDDAERKPRWKAEGGAPRSAGYKSHGGSADRPARSAGFKSHGDGAERPAGRATGFKSHAAEGGKGDWAPRKPRAEGDRLKGDWKPKADGAEGKRTYKPRAEGAEGKPFRAKPGGAKPAPRPAKPKADARDTSKRFVPPKKK
ncbi:DEAD/DEAH box helicase [Rhodobacteraceae bacterium HSP-20]|uniref:DEAD/DEAH box helicase n=1 Tax=Paragemmobacter amnigenus TaxID=2852097 RepID=A0ABS6J1Z1_9RHOB|nr:DEAD/DEAH box helicase [Rhodobacter amnigenus]MBU9697779.1 DEAD/DEAH box helicase [Rhodobacter amnigenus]MBV4389006.1 DEAD/DEAH box helicase [Rhodobacter amnigenus]